MQFEPILGLEAAHMGLFWSKIRDQFPVTETKPPLSSQVEIFGGRPAQQAGVQFIAEYLPPRVWLSNEAGTELVQLQQDRFIFNWRQRGDSPYPRYEKVRAKFDELSALFVAFLESEGLGKLAPNQCEVSYINHVLREEAFPDLGKLEAVLCPWSGRNSDEFLPEPEEVACRIAFRLTDEESGEPYGRLHAIVEPRMRAEDQARLLRIVMTARGLPRSADMKGVSQFLDVGREHVVRGFAALTTPEMHKQWGRDDAKRNR